MIGTNELISVIGKKKIIGTMPATVGGLADDSRKVRPGDMFIALHGFKKDGADFIDDACASGASVIVTEREVADISVPQIIVPSARRALALLACAFYGNPSEKLDLIGITGTNGKTTVTYILESIFRSGDVSPAVLGTIEYRIGDKVFPALNTTPSSLELQSMLSRAVKDRIRIVFMEVSSHSLVLDRVYGSHFHSGIFTNLSSEHLDFHGSLDEYGKAKQRLFGYLEGREAFAVINTDDDFGKVIYGSINTERVSYGLNKGALIRPVDIKMTVSGSQMTIVFPGQEKGLDIKTGLIGKSNIYNILASVAFAWKWGLPPDIIRKGIENTGVIPGRFEKVELDVPFNVIVDYAHTPDALDRLLDTARILPCRRLITVFGCGGDRDRLKRPVMGQIAVSKSDYVFVTSDNPRTEDPSKILLDIETGIKKTGKSNYKIIPDRREAIRGAVRMASKGDLVILAGKGHEDYQIVGEDKLPFDDRKVVKEVIG